ncbi:pilus assembly protein PilP [Bdellovibrionota bacterium]
MKPVILFALLFLVPLSVGGAESKRDPFRPLVTKWRGSTDRPLLQQYDLSQLKLAGVIWGTSKQRILFEDPTGRSHIATKKSKVGKKQGIITKITKYYVIIREDVKKSDGSVQKHFTKMRLKR